MKLVIFQHKVNTDKAKSLEILERKLSETDLTGVDLVVLPEMWACPYETDKFPEYAESRDGFLSQGMAALAKKHGIYLVGGSIPENDGGRIYNTSFVYDREGRLIARHRKMHLFDIAVEGGQHFRESDTLTAGDEVTVFETDHGRVGLCICYDFRFPELARQMALLGAEVILVPAAFNMTTGPAHWELLFRQRAVDNQVYCVGCAPARDLTASYTSWGHSLITDPWGNVVLEAEEEEGVLTATLDPDMIRRVREQLPLLKHRRTDVYKNFDRRD